MCGEKQPLIRCPSLSQYWQDHDGGFSAQMGQQAAYIVQPDEQGGGIDQRMALHLLGLPDLLIHHQFHRLLRITHHGEQGDGTRG